MKKKITSRKSFYIPKQTPPCIFSNIFWENHCQNSIHCTKYKSCNYSCIFMWWYFDIVRAENVVYTSRVLHTILRNSIRFHFFKSNMFHQVQTSSRSFIPTFTIYKAESGASCPKGFTRYSDYFSIRGVRRNSSREKFVRKMGRCVCLCTYVLYTQREKKRERERERRTYVL